MKLNYKKTILIGFAFFLICAFWQAYDAIIPKILVDKFGLNHTWSGLIMSLDNILALIMLPLFGAFSDKTKTKFGRRTPYIFIGTLVACLLFVSLSVTDNVQLNKLYDVLPTNSSAQSVLYDYNPEIINPDYTMGSEEIRKDKLQNLISREDFLKITMQVENTEGKLVANADYNGYVVSARQAYAWGKTVESPVTLVFFMLILIIVLFSMSTFRAPAVALMPDVTIKPLRSKANAVINLMGSIGGIIVLGIGLALGTGSAKNALMSYMLFFILIAVIMIVSLLIFIVNVKENKLVQEKEQESIALGLVDTDELTQSTGKLSRPKLISLLLLLSSVVFWFMGYNAVTSKYSVYAGTMLGKDFNATLMIAQAAAIVSFLPIGMISSKIGRKKMILIGIVLLTVAFGSAYFIKPHTSTMLMNLLFAMAGIGWASINVNSYPMVVEMSSSGDVGKYTGYYYTASMSAQILTPVISGLLMDSFGMSILFPYAAIFVALAIVTMSFVRFGDSRLEKDELTGMEIK